MKPTLEELEKILKERTLEEKRRNLAIALDICPECGEKLLRTKESTGFFFRESYAITKCSVNETHYNQKRLLINYHH